MPSRHLILCCPLLLLPQIHPSIRVFSSESTFCMRWPKYWSFSFSISPSKEIPGLISFRMDWLDLPAVQGTLKNLLQHHRSKASILRHSAFFTVQLSHPYMTTGKTRALTRWTFVSKRWLAQALIYPFNYCSVPTLGLVSKYFLFPNHHKCWDFFFLSAELWYFCLWNHLYSFLHFRFTCFNDCFSYLRLKSIQNFFFSIEIRLG